MWWPASSANETYIDMAFRWAHAADPAAKLFWNDGCAEGGEPKAVKVYDLLKSMLSRGVPVHGVGLEMRKCTSKRLLKTKGSRELHLHVNVRLSSSLCLWSTCLLLTDCL